MRINKQSWLFCLEYGRSSAWLLSEGHGCGVRLVGPKESGVLGGQSIRKTIYENNKKRNQGLGADNKY